MVSPGLENYGNRQKTVKRFCPTHIAQLGRGKWGIKWVLSRVMWVGHISGVSFSPNGTDIVANYSGERVYLFDMNNTKETSLYFDFRWLNNFFRIEFSALSPEEKKAKLMNLTSEQLRLKGNKAAHKNKNRLVLLLIFSLIFFRHCIIIIWVLKEVHQQHYIIIVA